MKQTPSAFSLVELMAVMAVIAILAAAVLPAVTGVTESLRLTSATQSVADEIQVARATAMARNLPVDVWFLEEDDKGIPVFRAIRSAVVSPTEEREWISPLRRLPASLAIAPRAEWSNIIGGQTVRNLSSSNYKGVALRIYPSGRAELADDESAAIAPSEPLFVTIGSASLLVGEAAGGLPANFATVKVSPADASVAIFRP